MYQQYILVTSLIFKPTAKIRREKKKHKFKFHNEFELNLELKNKIIFLRTKKKAPIVLKDFWHKSSPEITKTTNKKVTEQLAIKKRQTWRNCFSY